MGPFELMDLIGLDVNIAVTRSVWEAFFHDARFTPSVMHTNGRGRISGAQGGRGFFEYGANAQKPVPTTELPQARPGKIARLGELRRVWDWPPVSPLPASRRYRDRRSALCPGCAAHRQHLVAGPLGWPDRNGDRREGGHSRCRDDDLVFDYANCPRSPSRARTATVTPRIRRQWVRCRQRASRSPVSTMSRGCVVLRTVAMLANEVADAVAQGIASAADVDLAMRKGSQRSRAARSNGATRSGRPSSAIRSSISPAHYGEDRYRLSPLIARRCASAGRLSA